MGRTSILMYHSLDTSGSVVSVDPTVFAEQMACLAALGYRGIALRDAVAQRSAQGAWPQRSVVITFDDGYANFLDSALPVLQHHGFSATIFLVSGHLGTLNDWATPPPGLGAQRIVSPQQARDLAAAGVEIGAHTRTHPNLRRLDPLRAEDEIVGSRDEIAAQLGAPVESFAYPFGVLSAAGVAAVRRAFRAACTTVLRRAGTEPLHELPRIDMFYIRSRSALERLLTGELDRYLAVRRWARAVRRMAGG